MIWNLLNIQSKNKKKNSNNHTDNMRMALWSFNKRKDQDVTENQSKIDWLGQQSILENNPRFKFNYKQSNKNSSTYSAWQETEPNSCRWF